MEKVVQKKALKWGLLVLSVFFGISGIITVVLSDGEIFRTNVNSKISGDSVTAEEWNYIMSELPGEFIGFSTASSGAAGSNSYQDADALCAALDSDARVCSMSELIRGVAKGRSSHNIAIGLGSEADPYFQAWVSEGAPGYFAPVKDCNGWTDASASEYGSIFSFHLKKALILECDKSIPFACCK